MIKKYKDLSKNTLLFSLSNFGSKLIGFIFVPIYTAVLTTAEYGSLDLVSATAQLITPLLTLCIQDGVLRFSLGGVYKKEDVLRVSSKAVCISSLCLGAVLIVVQKLHLFGITPNYCLFLYATYIMMAINNSLTMYLKASDKVKVITVCGLVNTFVTCICNIVLLLVIRLGVNGYMISYISGYFVANMGMILFGQVLKDLKKGKYQKDLARQMIAYSMPMAVNSVAWWINSASDRYILTLLCGTTINGIYAISYKIPYILSTLNTVFYQAWSISAITEFDREDKDGFISNIFSLYFILSVVCCSVIMVFNMVFAHILYSNEFFTAWKYVPMLLVGTAFYGVAQFEGCFFTAVKDTKTFSKTTILAAAINTVLNFALVPLWGALGAAFATMTSYCAIFFIRWFILKKIMTLKLSLRPMLISLVLLLLQSAVATFSENLLWQLPLLALLIAVNGKGIVRLLRLLKGKLNSFFTNTVAK